MLFINYEDFLMEFGKWVQLDSHGLHMKNIIFKLLHIGRVANLPDLSGFTHLKKKSGNFFRRIGKVLPRICKVLLGICKVFHMIPICPDETSQITKIF